MLRLLLAILLVISLGCHRSEERKSVLRGLPHQGSDLVAGAPAKGFELKDLQGNLRSLADFRGKLVLINFWATWCAPCVAEMPALERLHKRFRDQGFEVLSINGDAERELVEAFVRERELSMTVLLDPTLSVPPKYAVEGFPESAFIDRSGNFVSILDPVSGVESVRILSDRPWDSPAYVKLVEQLLAKETNDSNNHSAGPAAG